METLTTEAWDSRYKRSMALVGSRSKEERDHVWLAFWNYLVAPRTSRKPFGLSSQTADLLIAEFQGALSELG